MAVPIWSNAYEGWGGSPWGDFREWAPWYRPLTGRIPVTEAGPDVRAAEIYNQLLPFLHPRDMQTYLNAIIANPAATSEGQPLEDYKHFLGGSQDMAKNWTPPRRLTMSEEYGMSKQDKVGRLADVLLGQATPVSGIPGGAGPFERPGDENIDSLIGGLIEIDDPIRPYVEGLLRSASMYAPGSTNVASRRSMAQQAEYETAFGDALDALRQAEDAEGSPWSDSNSGSGYVSNILESALEPGYYRNPAGGSQSPAARKYRYLFDQYKPYSSRYYY